MAGDKTRNFELSIPLDASQVEGFEPDTSLKVAIRKSDGSVEETIVKLGEAGTATANFGFAGGPGAGHIVIGPAEAPAEELFALQTLAIDLPSRQWGDRRELVLKPIKIPPYYWHWWRRWCRKFTIRGRVVCQDGSSPVPGARVCAYDQDWWFFWRSRQLIGCAVTDADGTFEINFRWCCGWWPWWWWRFRVWELDPEMVKRIRAVLQRNPALRLGRIGNQPSLAAFADILGKEMQPARKTLSAEDIPLLEKLQAPLLEKLPQAPDLEALHVWPWWPWRPWLDCTPDVVFTVTQDCKTLGTVIYTERLKDTRWNIPNPLDVTLVANDKACCVLPDPPPDPADCLEIAQVCSIPVTSIAGNYNAAAGPAGYLQSGVDDRPFAGVVSAYRDRGDLATVDYLEVQCSGDGGATWQPVQLAYPGALMDYYRQWWYIVDPAPYPIGDVLFHWDDKDGHTVVESREHFEAHGGLSDWGTIRHWMFNENLVFVLDSSKFPDDTYTFQVVGYREGLGGTLVQVGKGALPLCGDTLERNKLVLTFDNRLEDDPAHPTSGTHLCGVGTVHLCTTEPDTDFISVKVGGTAVKPCDFVNRLIDEFLEIEFMAHDPDGHLYRYELRSTWGESEKVDLLDPTTGSSLTSIGGDPVGPTYAAALGQGAVAPLWYGSKTYKLTVPVSAAFPEPCCYQLELVAYKQTVVNCDGDYHHWNQSQYNLGVGVCLPLPVVIPGH